MNEANENLEAEQAFLGALLSNNGVLHLVALDPDDFSEPVHARIFSAAASLINDGRLATAVTLKSHFENDVTLKEIGGTAYLARLVANATTIINAQEYAMIIRDLAIRRRTVTLMRGTIEDLAVQSADSSTQFSGAKIAADLSMQLSEIASSGIEERTRYTMKEAIIVAIDQTALAYQNNGQRPDAVATGIKALDNIIGGLVAETLVIVAGRPAMGKTTMGSVLAYNAAKAGVRTDFYSLDMTVANLAQRLGSIETKTPYERMQWGRISEQEFIGLTESAKQLAALPLTIIARAGLSLAGFEAEIAKSKMRQPDLFLVIIDQLSQVTIGGKYIGQRMNEIAAITASLKAIAIRYKVCVVLLHQLSRAADNREGNRPQLSDLRDSGSLEQDANVVLFPFREEYYLAKANPKQGTTEFLEWQEKMDLVSGVMEIIVAKNSMGRIGSAKVSCDLSINLISDLAETQETLEMF